VPDFDTVPANPIPPSQSRCTPRLEKPFWSKIRCAVRTWVDRSANNEIKSLPDDAKAEIVKEIVEMLQLTLSKSSPNETPRIRAHPELHQFESQPLPMDEQTMGFPIGSWGSFGGESSNQGLGLALPSSESLPSSPRERSFISSGRPRCKCRGPCECPPWPWSYFNEQYEASEASDVDQ
jgi:hypothetical protein